ncbi:DUF6030 family protein [Aliirhizobium smilacinae]|uniref:Uncharacterized protein n=1 Tax=Aliirhizobium smilacinae TaxID=1395944 RepID=A0A5C4XR00_9HYPH|nr:DUF6030 family protein [Rhizobium smilacinae]TNM65381.1 hypothetical protein FHP24_03670 [Rhizobium smilacinae]
MKGKAEIMTPLKHLQRRRRATRIFSTLLVTGVVALACFILSVNDGRNYRRFVLWLGAEKYVGRYLNDYLPDYLTQPFSTPVPTAIKSRRMGRVSAASVRLTEPKAVDLEMLQQRQRLSTYERCESLASDGTAAPTFQAAGGEWECLYSRELGSAAEPSVLFIQIKGVSSNEFRTFRLKLNRLDPSQDGEIMRLALASINNFGLEMSSQNRRYLENRIQAGETFSSRLGDFRVSLDLERGDSRRLNIIIIQRPDSSCSDLVPAVSQGLRMHASMAPYMLGCLALPSSSRPVEPD